MRHTAPPAAPLCRHDTLRGAELNGRDRHRLYCQLRLLYVLDGLPEGDAAVPEADRSCITRAAEGVERELRQFRWVLEALTDAEACRHWVWGGDPDPAAQAGQRQLPVLLAQPTCQQRWLPATVALSRLLPRLPARLQRAGQQPGGLAPCRWAQRQRAQPEGAL